MSAVSPSPALARELEGLSFDHARIDRLMLLFAIVAGIGAIGILLDSWRTVLLCLPALVSIMLLQGTLRHDHRFDPLSTTVVVLYLLGLAVLFLAVALTGNTTARFWGLPVPTALFVYAIWPYTAILSGFLYAFVFQRVTDAESRDQA